MQFNLCQNRCLWRGIGTTERMWWLVKHSWLTVAGLPTHVYNERSAVLSSRNTTLVDIVTKQYLYASSNFQIMCGRKFNNQIVVNNLVWKKRKKRIVYLYCISSVRYIEKQYIINIEEWNWRIATFFVKDNQNKTNNETETLFIIQTLYSAVLFVSLRR